MAEFEFYTPSIRFESVKKVYRSLKPFVNRGYDVRWTIVFDSYDPIFFEQINEPWVRQLYFRQEGGVAGNYQRGFALDRIDGQGICFSLDDDTIIHPDYFSVLTETTKNNPTKRGFLFHDQLSDDSLIKAVPGQIHEGMVGNQNFALRRDLIGDTRPRNHYCSDGEMIERLYKQHPNEFVFINQVLAYHNRTLWRTDWEDWLVKDEA